MDIKNKTSFFERTETVASYLKDINNVKVMTAAEEKAAFEEYNSLKAKKEAADNFEDAANIDKEMIAIRNNIITRNQKFVFAIAKRYTTNGNLLLDLVNEGNIGLMVAFDSYDVNTNNRFCSYAVWYIRRQIDAYMNTMVSMVHSTNNNKIAPKVKEIMNRFFLENGRNPDVEEIKEILSSKYNIEVKDDSEIYDIRVEYISSSANNDNDDDASMEDTAAFNSYSSVMNIVEDEADNEDAKSVIATALKFLNCRERKIVELSFGLDGGDKRTNKEVAAILGNITSERVRQIKDEAIKKMHSHLKASF